MDILRFITAGNIDDGKSTLIGRLLYDTNNIKKDILKSFTSETSDINLAFATDGLRQEREENITIDVAYKYFTTNKRKYIITDAPGHFQYTKNLVTGASNVDVMIILIDAQNGITAQTKTHSLVASFLNIKNVIIAVNKMDLIFFDRKVFLFIKKQYQQIAKKLNLTNLYFIPISALYGDNVTFHSKRIKWYNNRYLLEYLNLQKKTELLITKTRISVLFVTKPTNSGQPGYICKILSGCIKKDDLVFICPSQERNLITKIINGFTEVDNASAGQNVCIFLEKGGDIVRGNLLSGMNNLPIYSNFLTGIICWLSSKKVLRINKNYIFRLNSFQTVCEIFEIIYKIDSLTFETYNDNKILDVNQFASIKIRTKNDVFYDPFLSIPQNGRGVLIDIKSNTILGAITLN